jgi:hypothetical protein
MIVTFKDLILKLLFSLKSLLFLSIKNDIKRLLELLLGRDENGSNTDRYRWYYICFYIFGRIQIWIRIVLVMPDKIRLDVDIINIRFKYSDTDTISDVEYSDSDTDISEPL